MHLDIGLARLRECVLGGYAGFGEAGGVDDVCIRRLGTLVDELENGSLMVGCEGGHGDAQGSSEVLAEVLQILQRCDGAVNALVPRPEVRHVGSVDNDDAVVALRRPKAGCRGEGGPASFLS